MCFMMTGRIGGNAKKQVAIPSLDIAGANWLSRVSLAVLFLLKLALLSTH